MLVLQFEKMDMNTQAKLTWKEGVHLAYRNEGNYYMSLYRLNDFYVEVQYHIAFDGIAGIKSFVCEDELQSYLSCISLSEFFQ